MSIVYAIYPKCVHETSENMVINFFFLITTFFRVNRFYVIDQLKARIIISRWKEICVVNICVVSCYTKRFNNMTRNCSCAYNPQSTAIIRNDNELHSAL